MPNFSQIYQRITIVQIQKPTLKLDPLSPTSLGTIDNFTANDSKIFTINNPNESQAFGITLEPAGGSKTPTLEQLYTLGAV